MRFVHTADWHLGKIFHGVHLTEDQAHLLESLYQILNDEKAECLVVSGDIYDRSVPPVEAVELLDDFMCRVTENLGIKVIMCSGNHDSPERLRFASRLLEKKGLFIAGHLPENPVCITLSDAYGEVAVYPLPYFEPALVRSSMNQADIHTHAHAMTAVLSRIRESMVPGKRTILAAHCFVENGRSSESERPVSVGGAEAIPASVFAGFHYTALGHLHRPQIIAGTGARYSGSLMRYSFSETDHDKFFHIVDMDGNGNCTVTQLAATPRHQLRTIRGLFDNIVREGMADPGREDYLHVELLDKTPVYEAMRRLREVYPNTLHIERTALIETACEKKSIDHRKTGPVELFQAFYRQSTGEDLSPDQLAVFESVLERMRRQEQEIPV